MLSRIKKMNADTILKIIDTILQFILVIFAGLALSVWKKEVRGKDRYKLAKDLLSYIREIRFLIHTKSGSWHQIYINDIFTDRENFYNDQLSIIKNEKVVFDQNVWGLLNHINTRSDILLPKSVRLLLEDLCPRSGKRVGSKEQFTYIQIGGVEAPKVTNLDDDKEAHLDAVYQMHGTENWTLEEYFKRWEKLIIELQKSV